MSKEAINNINTIFPMGDKLPEMFAKNFIRNAYLNMLTQLLSNLNIFYL